MHGLSDTRAAYVQGKLEWYQNHREEYSTADQLHIDAATTWHLAQVALYAGREFTKYNGPTEPVVTLQHKMIKNAVIKSGVTLIGMEYKRSMRLRRMLDKDVSTEQAINHAGRMRGFHFECLNEVDEAKHAEEEAQREEEFQRIHGMSRQEEFEARSETFPIPIKQRIANLLHEAGCKFNGTPDFTGDPGDINSYQLDFFEYCARRHGDAFLVEDREIPEWPKWIVFADGTAFPTNIHYTVGGIDWRWRGHEFSRISNLDTEYPIWKERVDLLNKRLAHNAEVDEVAEERQRRAVD